MQGILAVEDALIAGVCDPAVVSRDAATVSRYGYVSVLRTDTGLIGGQSLISPRR